jgi:MOSC domain-containing protein YiiM
VKEAQHKLGIYARIAEPGTVGLGDPVELIA